MPRTTLMDKRSYDAEDLDLPVVCPAGERVGETAEGPGCHCRIEGQRISAARDGSTLAIFCMGSHELCPTWRAAREIEWEHRAVAELTADPHVQRSFTMEDIQEINERRDAGDFEGAEKIQARIREARAAQGLRDVPAG